MNLTVHVEPERIIAAAIRIGNVTTSLPPPARHFHVLAALRDNIAGYDGYSKPSDQGFLTSKGRYVGRVAAKRLAEAAGQMLKPSEHRELFSEDLW